MSVPGRLLLISCAGFADQIQGALTPDLDIRGPVALASDRWLYFEPGESLPAEQRRERLDSQSPDRSGEEPDLMQYLSTNEQDT